MQPDLAETISRAGYLYYYGERDYERRPGGVRRWRGAGLPNDADVIRAIGAIERRQGKWEQSTKTYQKRGLAQSAGFQPDPEPGVELCRNARLCDGGEDIRPRSGGGAERL